LYLAKFLDTSTKLFLPKYGFVLMSLTSRQECIKVSISNPI